MPIIQEKKVALNVDISKLISPTFYEDLMDLMMYKYSYLWEYGGRGSFKSSFIGIAIPLLMMNDPYEYIGPAQKIPDHFSISKSLT